MSRITMKALKSLITFAICAFSLMLNAQNTVGLITNQTGASTDAYVLIFPHGQQSVFLLDNCGRVVHVWPDTTYQPGNSVYLMSNGDIVRCGRVNVNNNPGISAGGFGEMVERRDWNNQLIWRFTYNDSLVRMHHDIEMLPNGNVLIVAWEVKSIPEAVAAGKDTSLYFDNALWPDHVIEVEPLGVDSGSMVWEWHAWDHMIQDLDSTKANFGVVQDHPELVNINYAPSGNADWLHINAIDHDPDLDQIMLCVPHLNEVWIIDHSTTTAEAASHSGGNSGRGGDLLYRWGNPEAYDRGTPQDQQLFFPHDAHWMNEGILPSDPDLGRILVFNNQVGPNYSAVDIIAPPVDSSGQYMIVPGTSFGPPNALWRYLAPTPSDLFSNGLSGAQKLQNGHFLICSGRQGRIFEIDQNEDVVWEYENPFLQGAPLAQGTLPPPNGNVLFRATHIPPDHPGIAGRTLSPLGYIELDPDTLFCGSISLGTEEVPAKGHWMFPNPANDVLRIQLQGKDIHSLEIVDISGRVVLEKRHSAPFMQVDVQELANGPYLVRANKECLGMVIIDHGSE